MTASAAYRATATERILAHPLHRACDLAVLRSEAGQAEISFAVNDFTGNIIGTLHGGILYALMDVAAFMALLSVIPEGLHGVTADIQVSVLRAARAGDRVQVRGRVDRIGRTLANMRTEAFLATAGGERLVATATVVKSLIASPF